MDISSLIGDQDSLIRVISPDDSAASAILWRRGQERMTGPAAVSLRFHPEIVGNLTVSVEAAEAHNFDLEAVKSLVLEGLTVHLHADLDDMEHLALAASEAPAEVVTHEPDAKIQALFNLEGDQP